MAHPHAVQSDRGDRRDTVRFNGVAYRRRMRELVARLRAQREEEQKAGLPGLEAGLDAIDTTLENMNVSVAEAASSAHREGRAASERSKFAKKTFEGSSAGSLPL